MILADSFFLDIKKIYIAHKCTLNRVHKCAYPKGRGQYGLVYALRGNAEFHFSSGERFTLGAGGLLFLFPNAAYSIKTQKDFEHYTVNFALHEENSTTDIFSHSYCLLEGQNTEHVERSFRRLVRLWQERRQSYQMQTVGCLYDLLSLFHQVYTDKNNTPISRLMPAKKYIEQNFTKDIRLDFLANLCNMSVTNFRREWKKQLPDSPLQYRDNIRIQYAKEYMRSGYYTLYEIAEKCGFEDPNYFARFFKKKTGLTPGQAKKQYF